MRSIDSAEPYASVARDGNSAGGATAGLSLAGLLSLMREDWKTHERQFNAGLQVLVVQRLGAWRLGLAPGPQRKFASGVYRVLSALLRNLYGVSMYDTTVLGRRVKIMHHSGIVIGNDVVIGDNCLIRQNVTIALGRGEHGAPQLGRDIEIGAGAVIIGGVTVGDGARIGPNAVVIRDVPPGATVFAPPSKTMRPRKADAES